MSQHGRVGHLFQGRYKAIVVEPEAWAVELSRYVHLNPVRVGELGLGKASRRRQALGVDAPPTAAEVRERLRRLRSHQWNSYQAYVGPAKGPDRLEVNWVLNRMGRGSRDTRREAYRRHVESAVREGLRESPWQALEAQAVLAAGSFVEKIRRGLSGDEAEQPALRKLRRRARWEEAVAAVERIKGEPWAAFRDRRRDWGRDVVLYLGRKHCGLRLKEMGKLAGGLDYRSVG